MKHFPLAGTVLAAMLMISQAGLAQSRTIELDIQAERGPLDTFFQTSIGAGCAGQRRGNHFLVERQHHAAQQL